MGPSGGFAPPIEATIYGEQPPPNPDGECHCHSQEEIGEGEALFQEHLDELAAYCGGVMDGSATVCPYK